MDKEQLDKIQRLTDYSLQEITKMTNREFWQKITSLMAKGILTKQQHDWLNDKRLNNDLTKEELDLLDIFGGRVIK